MVLKFAKKSISKILDDIGLVDRFRKKNSDKLLILMYHKFVSQERFPIMHNFNMQTVSASNFEIQMEYIKKNYTPISFEELDELKKKNKVLPKSPCIITFDDGYDSNHSIAYPILKKYGIPATVFVTTGFIDDKKKFWWDELYDLLFYCDNDFIKLPVLGRMDLSTYKKTKKVYKSLKSYLKSVSEKKKIEFMASLRKQIVLPKRIVSENDMPLTWKKIKEMSDDGMGFGFHTVNHVILTRLPIKDAKDEINLSRKRMLKHGISPLLSFAYPNGTKEDYDEKIIDYLGLKGVSFAVTTTKGLNKIPLDRFELKRIGISVEDDLSTFKAKISGLYDCLSEMIDFSCGE